MIKFSIHSKFVTERGINWESVGKMSKYRIFDIFLDILHKLKENLGHQRVKKGLLSLILLIPG